MMHIYQTDMEINIKNTCYFLEDRMWIERGTGYGGKNVEGTKNMWRRKDEEDVSLY